MNSKPNQLAPDKKCLGCKKDCNFNGNIVPTDSEKAAKKDSKGFYTPIYSAPHHPCHTWSRALKGGNE